MRKIKNLRILVMINSWGAVILLLAMVLYRNSLGSAFYRVMTKYFKEEFLPPPTTVFLVVSVAAIIIVAVSIGSFLKTMLDSQIDKNFKYQINTGNWRFLIETIQETYLEYNEKPEIYYSWNLIDQRKKEVPLTLYHSDIPGWGYYRASSKQEVQSKIDEFLYRINLPEDQPRYIRKVIDSELGEVLNKDQKFIAIKKSK